ncbi:membrane protein [Streptomyces violaceorubidus]
MRTVRLLHRICRVYAGLGIAVPVLGFATAASMGVLSDAWLIASVTLTAVAARLLAAFVLPRQEELLEQLAEGQPVERARTVRLAMLTGLFNLLWASVTILMIVRPGSTTGA